MREGRGRGHAWSMPGWWTVIREPRLGERPRRGRRTVRQRGRPARLRLRSHGAGSHGAGSHRSGEGVRGLRALRVPGRRSCLEGGLRRDGSTRRWHVRSIGTRERRRWRPARRTERRRLSLGAVRTRAVQRPRKAWHVRRTERSGRIGIGHSGRRSTGERPGRSTRWIRVCRGHRMSLRSRPSRPRREDRSVRERGNRRWREVRP